MTTCLRSSTSTRRHCLPACARLVGPQSRVLYHLEESLESHTLSSPASTLPKPTLPPDRFRPRRLHALCEAPSSTTLAKLTTPVNSTASASFTSLVNHSHGLLLWLIICTTAANAATVQQQFYRAKRASDRSWPPNASRCGAYTALVADLLTLECETRELDYGLSAFRTKFSGLDVVFVPCVLGEPSEYHAQRARGQSQRGRS